MSCDVLRALVEERALSAISAIVEVEPEGRGCLWAVEDRGGSFEGMLPVWSGGGGFDSLSEAGVVDVDGQARIAPQAGLAECEAGEPYGGGFWGGVGGGLDVLRGVTLEPLHHLGSGEQGGVVLSPRRHRGQYQRAVVSFGDEVGVVVGAAHSVQRYLSMFVDVNESAGSGVGHRRGSLAGLAYQFRCCHHGSGIRHRPGVRQTQFARCGLQLGISRSAARRLP